jgi:hypothetical protein
VYSYLFIFVAIITRRNALLQIQAGSNDIDTLQKAQLQVGIWRVNFVILN